MIKDTADFLSKFNSDKNELKELVHDERGEAFFNIIMRARLLITEMSGLISDHLYDLLFGFVYGPKWIDWEGNEHSLHCGSTELVSWCKKNRGLTPMDTSCPYVFDFKKFKESIRTYRNLPAIIEAAKLAAKKDDVTYDRKILARADMYVDVGILRKIFEKILSMMSDPRFEGPVEISCDSSEVGYYRVYKLTIEQRNSYLQPSIKFIKERLASNSGDLGSLKKLIDGTAYWAIESDWEEASARINILTEDIFKPEFEKLEEKVDGFRHVLMFYHRIIINDNDLSI